MLKIEAGQAEVLWSGRPVWFNSLAAPDATVGDWVLVHAGLVLSVITQEEAREMEALLEEIR